MALEKILKVTGTAVPVPGDDLDTDRIIPARYMKCVTFDGLGEFMFYDVRFDEKGNKKDHPLNDDRFKGAKVLISGNNFGCGSSREHAPQAIYRFGIRALVAEGFAEIFFGNSTTLGIPCITVSHADRLELTKLVEADPKLEVTVDVEKQEVRAGGKVYKGVIRESARHGLTTGHWDPIADLLDGLGDVEKTAAKLPYMAQA